MSTNGSFGAPSAAVRLTDRADRDLSRSRLPDWSTDELMMALDLYLKTRRATTYNPGTRVVVDLSAELRSLRIFPKHVRQNPRFRNPSGVALKLHNFESIDPDHEGKGMEHIGALDAKVWKVWAHRPGELSMAVALIRARGTSETTLDDTGEDDEYEAIEGRILYREHRRYERDRKLVSRKKRAALNKFGRLACEVCDFDSLQAFGVEGVIDVHHVVPLYAIGERRTTINDLALVCPTCHRVLHRHTPIITPTELRAKRLNSVSDSR